MTFRQMEVFLAVCECKNISHASEKYNVSQQGISKLIRGLEQELNCVLLKRAKQGVAPTVQGEYFLAECKDIISRVENLQNDLQLMKSVEQENISLGMSYGVVSAISSTFMSTFTALHSNVSIEYNDHSDDELEKLFKNGEYDFCITSGSFISKDYICEKLKQEKVLLGIPKTHKLCKAKKVEISDIAREKFAMFSSKFRIRQNFDLMCQEMGFTPNIAVTSSDFNSIKELAVNNNYLIICPEHAAFSSEAFFEFKKFPLGKLKWNVYLIARKSDILSENKRMFYRHIKDTINKGKNIEIKRKSCFECEYISCPRSGSNISECFE